MSTRGQLTNSWLPANLVFDKDALERIYRIHSAEFETYQHLIAELWSSPVRRVEQILEPWVGKDDIKESPDANQRLRQRACARLLTRNEVTRLWRPSDYGSVITRSEQGHLLFLEVDAELFVEALRVCANESPSARLLLSSRGADDARCALLDDRHVQASIIGLIGSNTRTQDDQNAIIERFCQQHQFYTSIADDHTVGELEAYLDDISQCCFALGLTESTQIVKKYHAEYQAVKRWLIASRMASTTASNLTRAVNSQRQIASLSASFRSSTKRKRDDESETNVTRTNPSSKRMRVDPWSGTGSISGRSFGRPNIDSFRSSTHRPYIQDFPPTQHQRPLSVELTNHASYETGATAPMLELQHTAAINGSLADDEQWKDGSAHKQLTPENETHMPFLEDGSQIAFGEIPETPHDTLLNGGLQGRSQTPVTASSVFYSNDAFTSAIGMVRQEFSHNLTEDETSPLAMRPNAQQDANIDLALEQHLHSDLPLDEQASKESSAEDNDQDQPATPDSDKNVDENRDSQEASAPTATRISQLVFPDSATVESSSVEEDQQHIANTNVQAEVAHSEDTSLHEAESVLIRESAKSLSDMESVNTSEEELQSTSSDSDDAEVAVEAREAAPGRPEHLLNGLSDANTDEHSDDATSAPARHVAEPLVREAVEQHPTTASFAVPPIDHEAEVESTTSASRSDTTDSEAAKSDDEDSEAADSSDNNTTQNKFVTETNDTSQVRKVSAPVFEDHITNQPAVDEASDINENSDDEIEATKASQVYTPIVQRRSAKHAPPLHKIFKTVMRSRALNNKESSSSSSDESSEDSSDESEGSDNETQAQKRLELARPLQKHLPRQTNVDSATNSTKVEPASDEHARSDESGSNSDASDEEMGNAEPAHEEHHEDSIGDEDESDASSVVSGASASFRASTRASSIAKEVHEPPDQYDLVDTISSGASDQSRVANEQPNTSSEANEQNKSKGTAAKLKEDARKRARKHKAKVNAASATQTLKATNEGPRPREEEVKHAPDLTIQASEPASLPKKTPVQLPIVQDATRTTDASKPSTSTSNTKAKRAITSNTSKTAKLSATAPTENGTPSRKTKTSNEGADSAKKPRARAARPKTQDPAKAAAIATAAMAAMNSTSGT